MFPSVIQILLLLSVFQFCAKDTKGTADPKCALLIWKHDQSWFKQVWAHAPDSQHLLRSVLQMRGTIHAAEALSSKDNKSDLMRIPRRLLYTKQIWFSLNLQRSILPILAISPNLRPNTSCFPVNASCIIMFNCSCIFSACQGVSFAYMLITAKVLNDSWHLASPLKPLSSEDDRAMWFIILFLFYELLNICVME